MQASYLSLPAGAGNSLISLHLLSKWNPLRWASLWVMGDGERNTKRTLPWGPRFSGVRLLPHQNARRRFRRGDSLTPGMSTVFWSPFKSLDLNGGDPCGNRTHVCGVRGRRLNRLTNGPRRYKLHIARFRPRPKARSFRCISSPNGTRFAGLPFGLRGTGKRKGFHRRRFPRLQNRTTKNRSKKGSPAYSCRLSPRRISTGQLHALPRFHLRPINQVVLLVPYLISE